MRRLLPAIALTAILLPSVVVACNVPVFRYALEHWNPDPYRGVLLHRGPLSEADQKRLASFKTDARKTGEPGSPVNIAIRTVDLDASPEPADAALAASLKDAPLPQLVVQYPARHQVDAVVWSGAFDDASLKVLSDSPVRQELLKRLIAGQTAIWVLIESGDKAQDDTALQTLEEELANLPKTLKLPVQTDAPEDAIGDGPELRVEFSILRVGRKDSQEAAFVSMLMHSEADLAELTEPLVFPVFGRCRSLLPLIGPGISAENIRGSARFLAGACSCQVKEQNPGFDLLVTADWGELIPWAKSAIGAGELAASGKPELLPIASGAPRPAAPAPTPATAAETAAPETPATETTAAVVSAVSEPPATPAAETAVDVAPASAPAVAEKGTLPITAIAVAIAMAFVVALVLRR